ncbi:transposase, partial [Cyclobacterium jeungdonense]
MTTLIATSYTSVTIVAETGTVHAVRDREKDLLNASYFHIVFTLPDTLNKLALIKPAMLYHMLFQTAWSVVRDFAANPKLLGARTGMVSVLHTWGQNLSLHPHLHCIVPAGGLTPSGKWKASLSKGRFLFPVKKMSTVFRARMVQALREKTLLDPKTAKLLFSKKWVIYCKKPFFGPKQVIEYLGRYSHSPRWIMEVIGKSVFLNIFSHYLTLNTFPFWSHPVDVNNPPNRLNPKVFFYSLMGL